MTALPVDDLLAPLADDAPCGADLEYDAAFMAAHEAARGKPEQQFGDTLIPAQEPDWRDVHEQAVALAQRTRDLRVAVLLARSGARAHGLDRYGQALALTAGLLERYWDALHPRVEDGDATMRLNTLAELAHPDAGLADLRSAAITGGRTGLTVRLVELGVGRALPEAGETAATAHGVVTALRGAEAQQAGVLDALMRPQAALRRIEATLNAQGGGAPDLRGLKRLADCLAQAGAAARGDAAADEPGGDGAVDRSRQGSDTVGALASRSDVLRSLERVCEWIEHNEPSNPAPLLIRRAYRLMNKNFIEIIQDLVPEGIDQVERITGHRNEA